MVKKKIIKRVRKPINNVIVKKNSKNSVSRRDFETFKFGVERLKELEKELNLLDTRGFSSDVIYIKSILKNVSEIPNIERKIKILKSKINGKYRPRHKKKISDKTGLIRGDVKELKKEVKVLEGNVKCSDVSELKSEVKKLTGQMKFRKKPLIIDSGVDVLVDANFNSFLKEIKGALSKRLNTKEKEIDELLYADLDKRESKFKEKRLNLIMEFNKKKRSLGIVFEKKYALKLKKSLRKEVSEKFGFMLQRKLNAEKVKLSKRYVRELREHSIDNLEREKRILGNKLKNELEKKIKELKKIHKTEIEREMKIEESKLKKLRQREDYLEEKENKIVLDKKNLLIKLNNERKKMKSEIVFESHKKLESELFKKEKLLRNQLGREFELKLKEQIGKHDEDLRNKKIALEIEMQKKVGQILNS
jgi:hypothetical protein